MTNKTSESCRQLAELCREDSTCDLTPSLYADFPAIASKYERMEAALQKFSDMQFELTGDSQTTMKASAVLSKVIRDTANEALEYDPLLNAD